mgnify:CR=1 FL=1
MQSKLVEKKYLATFIIITSLFALWGFANDITNPMVAAFQTVMELSAFQASWVQCAFYGGYATMAIPAALFIRKYSYKSGILLGLALYAIGAFLFIPAASMQNFLFFCLSLYILTFGLAFLETTANPFILSLGSKETSTRRLNLAQAFNPMGSLSGMAVASLIVLPSLWSDRRNAAGETFFVTTDFTVSSSAMMSSVYEVLYFVGSKYNVLKSKYDLLIGTITESFETGDFSSYEWKEMPSNPWVIDNTNAYDGTYCARSAAISHKQYSILRIETDVQVTGELTFYRKVSSEEYADYLSFIVDGIERERWSGEVDWDMYSYKLSKGKHTLEWRYTKDDENSEGDDMAAVDKIKFPAQARIAHLVTVTDLKAEMQDNDVMSMTWTASENADEYIIRRDGEIVSTQTDTLYQENVTEEREVNVEGEGCLMQYWKHMYESYRNNTPFFIKDTDGLYVKQYLSESIGKEYIFNQIDNYHTVIEEA